MNEPLDGLFLYVEMSDDSGVFSSESFSLSERKSVTIPHSVSRRASFVAVYTAREIETRTDQIKQRVEFKKLENLKKFEGVLQC